MNAITIEKALIAVNSVRIAAQSGRHESRYSAAQMGQRPSKTARRQCPQILRHEPVLPQKLVTYSIFVWEPTIGRVALLNGAT